MKIILIFLMLFAQNPQPKAWTYTYIKGSSFEGYILNEKCEIDFMVENQEGRYMPTSMDITEAERLLAKEIAWVNRHHENQEGYCPVIDEHLQKYKRQYIGFVDNFSQRIIYINFVWADKLDPKLGKGLVKTNGGCSHYWSIKVNIDSGKVYGLEVNEPTAIASPAKKEQPKTEENEE